MSTWFAASTGTLVSWETSTGSILTPRSLAYSSLSSHAEPDHLSPEPVVFSTSHGAFASTATRSTPALWMASTRGLSPGFGASCAQPVVAANTAAAAVIARRCLARIIPVLP